MFIHSHFFRILLILIAFTLITAPLAARTLTAEDNSGVCGDMDIALSILIDDAAGMLSYQFDLLFDETLVTPTSVTASSFSSGFFPFSVVNGNTLTVAAGSGVPHAGGSGILCYVHISVNSSAIHGSTSPLDIQNSLITDDPAVEVDGLFTISCLCTEPPASFLLISPSDEASGSDTTLTLTWEDADTSPNQAESYDLYLDTNSIPGLHTSNITESEITISGLSLSTTYFWHITARNNCGVRDSATWSFSTAECTAPPSSFSNLSPSNGASNLTPVSLQIDWEDASFVTDYDLYLSSSSPPSLFISSLSASEFSVDRLVPHTTYSWYASAVNPCGSTEGPTWSFSTGGAVIAIETAEAECGSEVTIPLLLDTLEGLTNFQFDLYTDLSIATLVGAETSGLTTSFTISASETGDHFSVSGSSATAAAGSGAICTLTLSLSDQISSNTITIPLDIQNTLLNGLPPADEIDGTLQVTCCSPPGDVMNLSPEDGSIGLVNPVTLTWDAAEGASGYSVYLGSEGDSPALIATTEVTEYTLDELEEGTLYTWRITAENDCGTTDGPPWSFTTSGERFRLISVIAREIGAHETNWKSDATFFNPGNVPVPYTLLFTEAGKDGNLTYALADGTLDPRTVLTIPNLVETLFKFPASSGSLRILSEAPVLAGSRTYNDLEELGTYGQYIPSLLPSQGIGSSTLREGISGIIPGVRDTSPFRTNFGFTELSGVSTVIELSNGSDSFNLTVPPYSWLPLRTVDTGLTFSHFAAVRVLSGGVIYAYASVVDNRTGDAVFIPAQHYHSPAEQEQVHLVVPVIARAQGGHDTNWLTDMNLYNATSDPLIYNYSLYSKEQEVHGNHTLGSGASQLIPDVLTSLFPEITGDATASMHIYTLRGLILSSRIYNSLEELGTYGQFVGPREDSNLLKPGETDHLLQLSRTDTFRCNVGFTNADDTTASITVKLFDDTGSKLGEKPFTLLPYRNFQITDIFAELEVEGSYPAARAEITLNSGGRIYTYASVVDNRTGDAIFIPASE